ncbi:hypothetical protein V2A87_18030 [Pseudomonas aeruginosa]
MQQQHLLTTPLNDTPSQRQFPEKSSRQRCPLFMRPAAATPLHDTTPSNSISFSMGGEVSDSHKQEMGGELYFYDVSRSGCQSHQKHQIRNFGFSEIEGRLSSPALRINAMNLLAPIANLMASMPISTGEKHGSL